MKGFKNNIDPSDAKEQSKCSKCGASAHPEKMGAIANEDGTCGAYGDNLTWSLDENGVLTINGTGPMMDYSYDYPSPWGTAITKAVISSGVTSIGNWAFFKCSSLTSVTIPEGVTNIGDGALYRCDSLTSVVIPKGVTRIGRAAFCRCTSLTSVTIPESIASIGSYAFEDCDRLVSMTIPNSVTGIGYRAFWGCTNLTNVYYGGSEENWHTISITEVKPRKPTVPHRGSVNGGNALLTKATMHYNTTQKKT